MEVAVNYFENIFNSSTCDRMEECLNSVPHRMTSDMQHVLYSEYNADEIKMVLFQMGPTKAPRLDGECSFLLKILAYCW